MDRSSWLSVFFCALALVCAAEVSPNAPAIHHVPIAMATRGTPVPLNCTIDDHGLTLTQSIAQVRLTDAGKPLTLQMRGNAKNEFETFVPAAVITGVDAFWYSLTATAERSDSTSTRWQRVTIVGSGKSAKPFWKEPALWVGGGLAFGGIIAAIAANNRDGSSSGNGSSPAAQTESVPDATEKNSARAVTRPALLTVLKPCTLSGQEQVSYMNLDATSTAPIIISVCRTCSNATVSADGSWGASDQLTNFNNPDCNAAAPTLTLAKPAIRVPPPPGTYTIEVRSNGQIISAVPWP